MIKKQNSQTLESPFSVQMGMWLLMLTISILFGAFTFAFIQSDLIFQSSFSLPRAFYASTLVLAASSFLLHWSWNQRNYSLRKRGILYTLVLGLVFIALQISGWWELYQFQAHLDASATNPVQYIYLLSGMHALHLFAGLGFLLFLYATWSRLKETYLEVATFFWHFLGVLWVFLLLVLILKI